jgi:hypothetical protein
MRPAAVTLGPEPSEPAALDRTSRLNLYARRRRIARIKAAAETLVWAGASVGLLLVAIGGLLTIH